MTLMFSEVAERITARSGESTHGRLSVLTGWLADAKILFDVPASAFVPPQNHLIHCPDCPADHPRFLAQTPWNLLPAQHLVSAEKCFGVR